MLQQAGQRWLGKKTKAYKLNKSINNEETLDTCAPCRVCEHDSAGTVQREISTQRLHRPGRALCHSAHLPRQRHRPGRDDRRDQPRWLLQAAICQPRRLPGRDIGRGQGERAARLPALAQQQGRRPGHYCDKERRQHVERCHRHRPCPCDKQGDRPHRLQCAERRRCQDQHSP